MMFLCNFVHPEKSAFKSPKLGNMSRDEKQSIIQVGVVALWGQGEPSA
jgi:hypothetical protein